ncbi:unnamed protein product [marine sediment metagenome]|uniref:HNH nuclease domain-containing protein n=1 Tax=marine sediment metagenome TaxID=412755 RepID=X1H2B5_9ZZZZ
MGKKQETCPTTVTKKLRAEILYRDGYNCMHPECHVHDSTGASLQIHHWDHNTANNFRSNLVTICVGCNLKEAGDYRRARNTIRKLHDRMDYWREQQKELSLG